MGFDRRGLDGFAIVGEGLGNVIVFEGGLLAIKATGCDDLVSQFGVRDFGEAPADELVGNEATGSEPFADDGGAVVALRLVGGPLKSPAHKRRSPATTDDSEDDVAVALAWPA